MNELKVILKNLDNARMQIRTYSEKSKSRYKLIFAESKGRSEIEIRDIEHIIEHSRQIISEMFVLSGVGKVCPRCKGSGRITE